MMRTTMLIPPQTKRRHSESDEPPVWPLSGPTSKEEGSVAVKVNQTGCLDVESGLLTCNGVVRVSEVAS